ncbi:MAG TPA: hypothetical protein VGT41_01970 [Candidatus Babeliales bacterium]|nr:hypothetical protein [Candidatus Babeliales bacterium]
MIVKARIEIENSEYDFKRHIKSIIWNGARCGCIYSPDKNFSQTPIAQVQDYIYTSLKAEIPATFYAMKENYLMEIIIECNQTGDFITIVPIAPFKKISNSDDLVDLGFYVLTCVELCSDFIIYELKSSRTESEIEFEYDF